MQPVVFIFSHPSLVFILTFLAPFLYFTGYVCDWQYSQGYPVCQTLSTIKLLQVVPNYYSSSVGMLYALMVLYLLIPSFLHLIYIWKNGTYGAQVGIYETYSFGNYGSQTISTLPSSPLSYIYLVPGQASFVLVAFQKIYWDKPQGSGI